MLHTHNALQRSVFGGVHTLEQGCNLFIYSNPLNKSSFKINKQHLSAMNMESTTTLMYFEAFRTNPS